MNNSDASGDALTMQRTLSLNKSGVSGVVVSAVSVDDYATYGISGGGGGSVGVQIVASVSIPTITTTASIGNSAKINTNDVGANAKQSVTVTAIADYQRLGIGGSLAIGGAAGIAPLADVLVSKHTTKASIGTSANVEAMNDVIVAANATEDVRAFVIGVAGGGSVAVAGSVGVVILKTQTQALIGDSVTVNANGNVVVSANDETDSLIVIGSAGLGLGIAGIGASVNVSILEKDTLAQIGNSANVSAQAFGSSINAYDGKGLTKVAAQGVMVQASSDEEILNVVVAGAAGFYAGVAGAVNVNLITANTAAKIGTSTTINSAAGGDVDQVVFVAAVNSLELDAIGGAIGGGVGAGVAGGVDVGIIRSNTTTSVGNNSIVNAVKDISVGSQADRDVASVVISASGGGGVGLAAAVSVYSLYATVDADSKSALNGSKGSNAGTFADSATNTSVISNGLGTYNKNSTTEGGQRLASAGNSAKSSVVSSTPSNAASSALSATPTQSRTSATISDGVRLKAGGSLTIQSNDVVDIRSTTGGVGVGGGGAGAGLTFISVGGQSLTKLGDSVTLTGKQIIALSGYDGTTIGKAYGGGAGFVGALGAQVAVISDSHNEQALVGNNATITATDKLQIETTSIRDLTTQNAGGAGSLGVAGEASYAKINSSGTARAQLGSNGSVTTGSGGVRIVSNSTTDTDAEAYGVAAGGAAINLTLAKIDLSAQSHASVGNATKITSTGSVDVRASYNSTADLDALGVTVGIGSVGAMDVNYRDRSSVSATLKTVGAFNITGKLNVIASADNAVDLRAIGTSVGGVAGNGAGLTVDAAPTVATSVSSTGAIVVGDNVSIVARASGEFDTTTTGVSIGGLAVGVSIVDVTWSPSVTTSIGAGSVISGGKDVTIRSLINSDEAGLAQTNKTVEVDVTAVSGSLFGGSAASVDVTLKTVTSTTIGAGSTLAATRNLVIGSDQRTRTNVDLSGVNIGFISGGLILGTVEIHASSTVNVANSTVAAPTRLGGGLGLSVKAGIDHGGNADITGGSGGLFGALAGSDFDYLLSGPDTAQNGDNVPVSVTIGDNTTISSAGTAELGTFVRVAFESDASNRTFGALGAAISNVLKTESRVAAAVSVGQNSKIGARNVRITTNQNVSSDTDTNAESYAGATSSTNTTSSSRYYSSNTITVATGTTIVATGSATIENSAGNVYVRADSYARGVAFIASVDATSNGTRNVDNRVTIASGTEIITPRLAVQSLRPSGRLDVSADSTNASALGFLISIFNAITGGSVGRSSNREETIPNLVDLNSAITLGSPRDVQLFIDANGSITKQNWPTVVIDPTRVVVDDIFTAQPDRLDVRAPSGTTKGTSTVTYGRLETVTIENASARTLVLGDIDTFSNGLNTPVYLHEASTKGWKFTENKQTGYSPDNVQITIRNTSTSKGNDIQLTGRLDATRGAVSITANGGDIYSLGMNDYINSRAVTLNATAGSLGRTLTPIYIRTPEQVTKTLPVGIQSAHGETGGHLNVSVTSPTATDFTYRVQNVTSNTGTMKIVANEGASVVRTNTTSVTLLDGSEFFGTVLGPLQFDPSKSAQFSAANDTITLPYSHGLSNGDRVIYQPTGTARIGGITPFVEREVSVVDAKTIQFNTSFNTTNVSTAKDTISFASPHGIQTGDTVVYDNKAGATIGGLTNNSTYFAWAYDDKTTRLYDTKANAANTGITFYGNTVQHIQNPAYDKDAKSGIATLKYLDVIALSANNTFTTGTKIEYWTHDTNTIRQWNGTAAGTKYWTNTLSYTPSDSKYLPGDPTDPANPNDTFTSTAQNTDSNFVSIPTLSYFYVVQVPNPDNKAEFNGLIALASSFTDATNGVVTKISSSIGQASLPHFLRSTVGLVDLTSVTAGQTQSFRADLTTPTGGTGEHVIDSLSVYVQDSKNAIVRLQRDQVKSIREVVAEVLSSPAGVNTTIEFGTISSTNGNITIQAGTSNTFITNAKIVDTISAPQGTIEFDVLGGSLINSTTNTNIIAKTADLSTWKNIGSETTPITGQVQFLTAEAGLSGTGGIWFENTGLLTLRDMSAVNDLQVVVVDRLGTGDDIVVDPTALVQSTAGTVILKAGDQITIPTSAKVIGFNGIDFYFNYNDVDGTGNIIDLRGFSGSKVINVYGNAKTVDTILDNNDLNYVITDNKLQRYAGRTLDTTFNLFNVAGDHFDIVAGGKDNSIDVTGWTGTGIYDGKAGINRLIAVNDVDFVLTDDTLSRTNHGNITFVNDTVRRVSLTGGASDNSFTLTNWTYQAFLDGDGGKDSIVDSNDVNYVLSDSSLTRSTVGNFNLVNIEHAVLTSGANDNRFEVSEWTGTAVLDGGAGLNSINTVRDGDYQLSDTKLVREISDSTAGTFALKNFDKSIIIAGVTDNSFDVSGWTGQAKIDGVGGIDRITTTSDTDAILNADFISRGDGGEVLVSNIKTVVLIGGKSSNSFLIEGWQGNVVVDGGGGGDDLTVNANTDYTLNASSIQLGNGTNIDVANLTKVTLNGGNEDNAITIEEQPDFYTVINTFGGDDSVTVSGTGDFTLTGSTLAINGTERYFFGGVDRVTLVGNQNDNNFLVDGWDGTLAIHGGAGVDKVSVVEDTNYVLTSGLINRATGHTIDIFSVERVALYGGDGDNRFEIVNYQGEVYLEGRGGNDVVQVLVPNNVALTDGSLVVQNGANVTLNQIERAVLIGTPGVDHVYSITNYTGQVSVHHRILPSRSPHRSSTKTTASPSAGVSPIRT